MNSRIAEFANEGFMFMDPQNVTRDLVCLSETSELGPKQMYTWLLGQRIELTVYLLYSDAQTYVRERNRYEWLCRASLLPYAQEIVEQGYMFFNSPGTCIINWVLAENLVKSAKSLEAAKQPDIIVHGGVVALLRKGKGHLTSVTVGLALPAPEVTLGRWSDAPAN